MRFSHLALTISAALVLGGCIVNESDDDGSGGSGGTGGELPVGGGGAGGEAACYEGTPDAGTEAGTWSEPNEQATHTITVPSDPGGGLVRLTLTVDHDEAIPWLNVLGSEDLDGAAILSGSAAMTSNEQVWQGAFVAAPGTTYQLVAYEFFNAPMEEHPVGYTLDWTFESRVDCYEPNDTLETAATIARGEDIEARFLAGYRVGGAPEPVLDHYAFDVEAPGSVSFTALSSPANATINMRLFRPDGSQIAGGGEVADGASMAFDVTEAGTYTLELRPTASLDMKVDQEDPDPEHFDATYRFRVD